MWWSRRRDRVDIADWTQPMTGFVPPPYPYDRLTELRQVAAGFDGGVLDFSIGTPNDDPAPKVVASLATSGSERGYPPSVGTLALRTAIAGWLQRRLGVHADVDHIAATVGSKEFVATLPQWMKLRSPQRDTVLYPATSYPTYAMGARLASCRAVPVAERPDGTMDLESIEGSDIERALLLWSNSPANPTGVVDDLGAIAAWGRSHDVPVFSDECYLDFTWSGPPRSILQQGFEGVVAVFSLSKRSNFAGGRIGYYAGDPDLVEYLSEVRKHVGLMPPGPSQSAAVVALEDDAHVEFQRGRYLARLHKMADTIERWTGRPCPLPAGAFYLWVPVGDGWEFTERLAHEGGALVAPGDFFGESGGGNVRIALVQSEDIIDVLRSRLGLG